jgi:hypothetical protein
MTLLSLLAQLLGFYLHADTALDLLKSWLVRILPPAQVFRESADRRVLE